MWRNIASNALTLLIVAMIALGGLVAWGQRLFIQPGPLGQAIFFEVERGDTLRDVSRKLAARGAITSAPVFRIGADYAGKANVLKFANYELPAGASMKTILAILTKGGQSSFRYAVNYMIGVGGAETRLTERMAGTGEIVQLAAFGPEDAVPDAFAALLANETPMAWRVTVAPGTTVWQVGEALKAAEFLSGDIGDLPGEGGLAPDTYDVRRGSERAGLIADMAAAQTAILQSAWSQRADGLPLETAQDALILASIVEKETGIAGERRRVASVFVNRLRKRVRLQTDPTVIYGITGGRRLLGRGLRASELRRETPWNTYVLDGLPKTPIANPSRAAIEAVMDPEETEFLYFVADGTGGHAFSRTLAEHNRNVARWRQIEAGRGGD